MDTQITDLDIKILDLSMWPQTEFLPGHTCLRCPDIVIALAVNLVHSQTPPHVHMHMHAHQATPAH